MIVIATLLLALNKPLPKPVLRNSEPGVVKTLVIKPQATIEQTSNQEVAPLEPVALPKPVMPVVPTGNDYDPGQCTWGVASWVSVPTGLGNANNWANAANSMGFPVSSSPHVGDVAVNIGGQYGHVAVVQAISGPLIQIKEMNVLGPFQIDVRWVSASEFQYYVTF